MPSNPDEKAEFARYQAQRRATEARINELASAPQPLAFPDILGRFLHIVSRDPEFPERWRTTRFDKRGASGHTSGPSFSGALCAAWDYGAIVEAAVAATPAGIEAAVAALGLEVGLDREQQQVTGSLDAMAGCTT